jgi:hypothetical protein
MTDPVANYLNNAAMLGASDAPPLAAAPPNVLTVSDGTGFELLRLWISRAGQVQAAYDPANLTEAAQRFIAELRTATAAPDATRGIQVYVSDDDRIMCDAPSCPLEGDPFLPGRRVSLGEVIDAFAEHVRQMHPAGQR